MNHATFNVAPPNLRPYQEKMVSEIRAAYRAGHRSVLLVSPTGSGKTVVFSYIAHQSSIKGTPTGILVHRDSLLWQTSRALSAYQVPHGIVAPGQPRTDHKVQVASVQSLVRRLDHYRFGFIVVDEAHHATATTWRKVFEANPQAYILGVTATPCRSDGRGLKDIFQHMILGPSVRQLISQGHLVQPVTYGPAKPLDLSKIRTIAGDYDEGQLAEEMARPTITGCAVTEYTRLCPGQPAVAFCVNVAHAEIIAAAFHHAGYRARAIHGKLPVEDIRAALADLESGNIQVLAQCQLVNEGLDIPAISIGIMLRPTLSLGLAIQQWGRCLRPLPGKTQAIILDHAGLCVMHGILPESDHEWMLDATKRKKSQAPPIKTCPVCYAVFTPAPECPQCGYIWPLKKQIPPERDATLTRVDTAEIERRKKAARREVGRANTIEELLRIQVARGYKPGWAQIVFRAKQSKQ